MPELAYGAVLCARLPALRCGTSAAVEVCQFLVPGSSAPRAARREREMGRGCVLGRKAVGEGKAEGSRCRPAANPPL